MTRHAGYALSLKTRAWIEAHFGWIEALLQFAMAASNRVRLLWRLRRASCARQAANRAETPGSRLPKSHESAERPQVDVEIRSRRGIHQMRTGHFSAPPRRTPQSSCPDMERSYVRVRNVQRRLQSKPRRQRPRRTHHPLHSKGEQRRAASVAQTRAGRCRCLSACPAYRRRTTQ